jgi:hypothetical protein
MVEVERSKKPIGTRRGDKTIAIQGEMISNKAVPTVQSWKTKAHRFSNETALNKI